MKKLRKAENCCTKSKKPFLKRKIFHNKLSVRRFLRKLAFSPLNTTQYLIKNNSTPFYSEDDIELVPSSMILFDDEKPLFDFNIKETLLSTNDETINFLAVQKKDFLNK